MLTTSQWSVLLAWAFKPLQRHVNNYVKARVVKAYTPYACIFGPDFKKQIGTPRFRISSLGRRGPKKWLVLLIPVSKYVPQEVVAEAMFRSSMTLDQIKRRFPNIWLHPNPQRYIAVHLIDALRSMYHEIVLSVKLRCSGGQIGRDSSMMNVNRVRYSIIKVTDILNALALCVAGLTIIIALFVILSPLFESPPPLNPELIKSFSQATKQLGVLVRVRPLQNASSRPGPEPEENDKVPTLTISYREFSHQVRLYPDPDEAATVFMADQVRSGRVLPEWVAPCKRPENAGKAPGGLHDAATASLHLMTSVVPGSAATSEPGGVRTQVLLPALCADTLLAAASRRHTVVDKAIDQKALKNMMKDVSKEECEAFQTGARKALALSEDKPIDPDTYQAMIDRITANTQRIRLDAFGLRPMLGAIAESSCAEQ